MMLRRRLLWAAMCAAVILLAAVGARADFVTIGNPDNLPDTLTMNDGSSGYGAVPYTYQISRTAVSIAEWDLFYGDGTSGLGGIGGGTALGTFNANYNYWNTGTPTVGTGAPAVNISFNHVAQYVNWLTTGDATDGYYTIDASGNASIPAQSHKEYADANGLTFFIPTEDEWYKAAYYTGSGYSLYADGTSDTQNPPQESTDGSTGWNYNSALSSPNRTWTVDSGTEEKNNGTRSMMGNVWEWNEALVGSAQINRGLRGGTYATNKDTVAASWRANLNPLYEGFDAGFRVASIPEPGGATMLLMGAVGLLLWRRRRTA